MISPRASALTSDVSTSRASDTEHLAAVHAHALDRLQRERAGKDRQPPEQHPLVLRE